MHTHTITTAQHAIRTYSGIQAGWRGELVPTYAKPGETQAAAIKRLMTSRKRSWSSPCKRSFPQWHPEMTTAEYVRSYFSMNKHDYPESRVGRTAFEHLNVPTTVPQWNPDDSVQVEIVD